MSTTVFGKYKDLFSRIVSNNALNQLLYKAFYLAIIRTQLLGIYQQFIQEFQLAVKELPRLGLEFFLPFSDEALIGLAGVRCCVLADLLL